MSKTLEEQFEGELNGFLMYVWRKFQGGNKVSEVDVKPSAKPFTELANQQTREALQRVLDNSSGGGSWRRVIHKELSTLTEDTNQEE